MTNVLFIGGTGEISTSCVHRAAEVGCDVTIFNRGQTAEPLPDSVRTITGDLANQADLDALAAERFDAVCQFIAFDAEQVRRDIDTFAGHCGQYLFISSASCYQKPLRDTIITEATPLENPYWPYSQKKIHAEAALVRAGQQGRIDYTIVRPSHTFRRKFPGGLIGGDDWAWRVLNGRAVIIQGDGTSLWTWTHADDFAIPFVNLLGNQRALGEAFHITRHLHAFAWNDIYATMARALGCEPNLVHVPTETLGRYNPAFVEPLLGDKAWSAIFDNTKVMDVAGPFTCNVSLEEGMKRLAEDYLANRHDQMNPDADAHALLDRIAAEQLALGN